MFAKLRINFELQIINFGWPTNNKSFKDIYSHKSWYFLNLQLTIFQKNRLKCKAKTSKAIPSFKTGIAFYDFEDWILETCVFDIRVRVRLQWNFRTFLAYPIESNTSSRKTNFFNFLLFSRIRSNFHFIAMALKDRLYSNDQN